MSIAEIKRFLFENQSIRQTIAKNTFWMAASQITGRLLRAAIIIYAARILGAESWGAFSYALGIAAFLTIFSDIGITGLITREASRRPELREKYLATALGFKLAMLAVGVILFFSFARLLTDNAEVLMLFPIIVFITVFDGFRDLANSMARATEKFEIEAVINIFTNFAIVALGFILLAIQPTSKYLAISYAIGSGLGLAAVIFAFRSYFSGLIKNFSLALLKPVMLSAWPFGLMGLMGAIMINTDMIMVGFLRTIQEVGLYSAAQRPIQLLYLIPGLLAVPLFPAMSRLAGDKTTFTNILGKAIRVVLLAAFPLAIGGAVAGRETMLLLFGNEYLQATSVFQILAVTFIITFPSTIVGNAIFATNREKNLIVYAILGISGNFLFNLLLIPQFGIVGAAWSTVITQIISNGYAWFKMRSYLNLALFLKLWKIAVASATMTLAVLLAKLLLLPTLLIFVVAAAVYLLSLIALKEEQLNELKLVFR